RAAGPLPRVAGDRRGARPPRLRLPAGAPRGRRLARPQGAARAHGLRGPGSGRPVHLEVLHRVSSQVERRRYGTTGVELSALGFGTMRLDPGRIAPAEASALLLRLHAAGVTTLHTSGEYAAHPLACEALRRARRARSGTRFEHVCKIAVPHFDEARFSAARLEAAVDDALRMLGAPRID